MCEGLKRQNSCQTCLLGDFEAIVDATSILKPNIGSVGYRVYVT